MSEIVTHAFAPVYDSESRVLILGTMPSPASRENGFYYSHPRNRFWPVMAEIFGQPLPVSPEEKKAFCLYNGIALWDVLKSYRIDGASDASIRQPEVNDIPLVLSAAEIKAVFTTGAKAAQLYRKHFSHIETPYYALPSTSPANCRMSMEELAAAYSLIVKEANG